MEKLVVDSSVAIKWVLVEPYSTEAGRILDEYKAGNLELIAPELIFSELANIVWKRQVFQNLPLADAQLLVKTIRTFPIATTATGLLLEDAFGLAVSLRRSVYDALYPECSRELSLCNRR